MKGLTEKQLERRDELVIELRAIEMTLSPVLASFNEKLGEARKFVEEIHFDMEAYASDHSDQWHEGEAGEVHAEWRGEWEGAELDDISFDTKPGDRINALSELSEDCE